MGVKRLPSWTSGNSGEGVYSHIRLRTLFVRRLGWQWKQDWRLSSWVEIKAVNLKRIEIRFYDKTLDYNIEVTLTTPRFTDVAVCDESDELAGTQNASNSWL